MKKLFCIFIPLMMALSGCGALISGSAVNKEALKKHTEYLTDTVGVRVVGTQKEKDAADYMLSQLEKCGFSVENAELVRQPFFANDNDSENIVATKEGSKDKIIMVVSHHDSVVSSIGAKDNASGSAALLEIARVLYADDDIGAEIRFISLGSEENGYHGSEYYVSTLTEDEKSNTIAVYNLDIAAASLNDGFVPVCTTLGGRTEAGYVDGNGFEPMDNAVSRSIEEAFFRLGYFKKEDEGVLYKKVHHYGESDHVSFHNGGMDSANVCWRKLDGERAALPPEYHQMTDTAKNIDYGTVEMTANAIIEAVKILDKEY